MLRCYEINMSKVLLKTYIPERSYNVLRKYAAQHFDNDMDKLMLNYWMYPSMYTDLQNKLFEVEQKSAKRLVNVVLQAKSVDDND